ncbi:MAG: Phosphate-import permease protein PhnE [Alphaproteobacteria bacterium MarineAlpha9_Bin3]|nr:MAG: Phosphate-import permease protein PhnE [Alphaproteobacteria bacterium MarineAlpha9_Bin3]|tara:strand:- start:2417 stop:3421 length:1005 start_codon:yes stop_codon:yes gene_type:complete
MLANNKKLKPPFNYKTIVLVLLIFFIFIFSFQRVGMPDIVDRLYEVTLDVIGLKETSKISEGLSRISDEMWPPAIETKKDINLILNFDASNLPFYSYIENQKVQLYETNIETLELESREEEVLFLVEPFGYLKVVIIKIIESIEIAFWASFIALIISIPLAFYSAKNYTPNRIVYYLSRSIVSGLRAIPELISVLFMVLAFGFGPAAGIMALGLHSAGFLGKFFAEDIENADKGPQEALQALGSSRWRIIKEAVLPQIMPQYIAYILYILDRNLRMATVIGLVGGGGIGQELKGRFDLFEYGHVTTIIIVIFIVVFIFDQISAKLRNKLIGNSS